jgi:hypothetical protein
LKEESQTLLGRIWQNEYLDHNVKIVPLVCHFRPERSNIETLPDQLPAFGFAHSILVQISLFAVAISFSFLWFNSLSFS